jgi:hypothetical protein
MIPELAEVLYSALAMHNSTKYGIVAIKSMMLLKVKR